MKTPRRRGGQDTSRQIRDFQGVQSALGRAAGWKSDLNKTHPLGRGALNIENINQETGEIPHFFPGQGHVTVVPAGTQAAKVREWKTAYTSKALGQRNEEFSRAREGDMYN